MALYLDAQGSVEVGAEVSEPFTGNERIHCSQLPAGHVVTTVHFGPYQRLSVSHTAIREWCATHGHRCSGIFWEIYGHWEESWNADPSKIRTDIFYLLDDQRVIGQQRIDGQIEMKKMKRLLLVLVSICVIAGAILYVGRQKATQVSPEPMADSAPSGTMKDTENVMVVAAPQTQPQASATTDDPSQTLLAPPDSE